jgi:Bacterial CdiA-CT RNAse A domain
MSRLALTPELASGILHSSEKHGGHTLERHVRITNQQLRDRHNSIDSNNWLKVATAFSSTADAARALCEAVNSSESNFVRSFGNLANGTESGKIECDTGWTVRARYGGGEMKFFTNRFYLAMQKNNITQNSLIVITIYPLFGMPL